MAMKVVIVLITLLGLSASSSWRLHNNKCRTVDGKKGFDISVKMPEEDTYSFTFDTDEDVYVRLEKKDCSKTTKWYELDIGWRDDFEDDGEVQKYEGFIKGDDLNAISVEDIDCARFFQDDDEPDNPLVMEWFEIGRLEVGDAHGCPKTSFCNSLRTRVKRQACIKRTHKYYTWRHTVGKNGVGKFPGTRFCRDGTITWGGAYGEPDDCRARGHISKWGYDDK